jgi:hypothetical protein
MPGTEYKEFWQAGCMRLVHPIDSAFDKSTPIHHLSRKDLHCPNACIRTWLDKDTAQKKMVTKLSEHFYNVVLIVLTRWCLNLHSDI